MVNQATLTCQELLNLTLLILAAEAEVYQVACGQSTCALGSDRTVTIQCVVGVDNATLAVCRYRDTATHVYNYEVEILIRTTYLLSIAACDSLLVESVEDRATRALLKTAHASHILKLVNNYGVSDVCLNTCYICDAACDESTKVAGVLTLRSLEVGHHSLAYAIYTTLDRAHKTATADNCVELLNLDTIVLESLHDDLQAPVELICNTLKACDLLS